LPAPDVKATRARPPSIDNKEHGRDTETSDLDVLVDPIPGTTLLDLGGLQVKLEELLGVQVATNLSGFHLLAGRIEIADLLPLFSQAEMRKKPCDFLERVLQGKPPTIGAVVVGPELVDRILAGGYPEAIERPSWVVEYQQLSIPDGSLGCPHDSL
jgi:hypothetical protein